MTTYTSQVNHKKLFKLLSFSFPEEELKRKVENKLFVADFRHYPQKLHRNLQSKACTCPTITYRVKSYLEIKQELLKEIKKPSKTGEDRFFPVIASNIFLAVAFIYSGWWTGRKHPFGIRELRQIENSSFKKNGIILLINLQWNHLLILFLSTHLNA